MKTCSSIILIVGSIMFLMGCDSVKLVQITDQIIDVAEGFDNDIAIDTEYNDKLGLVLSVDNVTSTGLCLICSQSGGQPTGTLKTGSSYNLEKYDSGKWYPVIPIIDNYGWQLQAFTIYKNQDTKFNINWEWLYGKLGSGTYRLEKNIIDFRESDNQDNYIYYIEFELNDE